MFSGASKSLGEKLLRGWWIAVVFLLLLFAIWCFLLPEHLFKVPYSTVLLDRQGQILGMKAAEDGQIRFRETEDRKSVV